MAPAVQRMVLDVRGCFWFTAAMGKHGLYYNLIDAFEQPGCPLCRLALTSVDRWLDSLSYESVNDYTVREQLRRARGLCTAHAWYLIDVAHDLLGAAIIARDVIETTLPNVGRALGRLAERRPRAGCPACQALAESEARYRELFRESLPERAFRDGYARGVSALCAPHVAHLVAATQRHQQDALLLSLQAERWQRLLAELAGKSPASYRRSRYRGIAAVGLREAPLPPGAQLAEQLVGRAGMAVLWLGWGNAHDGAHAPAARIHRGAVPWTTVLAPGACPVCRLTVDAEQRRLASAVTASVEAVARWCNAHTWRLLDAGHGARLQPLFADRLRQLGQVIAPADAVTATGGGWFGWRGAEERPTAPLPAALLPADSCPWCLARAGDEAWAVDALLEALTDEHFADQYRCSGGLCQRHSRWAMSRPAAPAAGRRRLARLQREQWTRLRDELVAYIRSQDYQFRHEPRGREQLSPRWATEQLASAKGLWP